MNESQLMTLWVTLWIAQMVFSVFVLVTERAVAKTSPRLAKLRMHIGLMGFLPCGGLMLVPQIIEYVILRVARGKSEANQRDLNTYLSSQGDFSDVGRNHSASSVNERNPFDTDSGGADDRSTVHDERNPFL